MMTTVYIQYINLTHKSVLTTLLKLSICICIYALETVYIRDNIHYSDFRYQQHRHNIKEYIYIFNQQEEEYCLS